MTAGFRQRAVRFSLIDIANLALGKGSSLILTTVLLFYASRTLTGPQFIEFVMWWSLAMMIGGIVLGGLATAAIRSAAVDDRLVPAAVVTTLKPYILPAVLSCIAVLAILGWFGFHQALVAALLGMVMQVYNSTVVVARSIKEYVQALVTSGICIAVSCAGHLTAWALGASGMLLQFSIMLAAFAIALTYGVLALLPRLKARRRENATDQMAPSEFWKVTVAFSIGYALVTSLLNIDYSLMRAIGLDGPIASEAGAKVYFERFVLPFWMLIANAAALEILRSPQSVDVMRSTSFTIGLSRKRLLLFAAQFAVAVAGYYVYRLVFSVTAVPPPLTTLILIGLAYVGYAIIGLVLDIYLLTTAPRAAIIQSAIIVLAYTAVSWVALNKIGGLGWAIAWLGVNAVIVWFTSRRNVAYKAVGR